MESDLVRYKKGMGSSDLETSRRKVGSKGPDSKAARAPSGTFTDTRA